MAVISPVHTRVGTAGRKILIQHIGSDSCPRLTFRRDRPVMSSASRQSLFSHQTRHPLAGTHDALVPQFRMNAWTSIHLPTRMVDFLNVFCHLVVFLLMLTQR